MESGTLVNKLLAKPEIDDINAVRVLAESTEEILGFDVSENKIVLVHELDAFKDLIRNHDQGFQGEFLAAEVVHVF